MQGLGQYVNTTEIASYFNYNWYDILCLTATEVSMIELFSITHIIEERKITYRRIRVQGSFSRFGHRC